MMQICRVSKDGGPASHVWGLFLIEIKRLFSVALLCFEAGSRDAYHSHAFNCVSWVLRGRLSEHRLGEDFRREYRASWRPFVTRRDHFHKVTSVGRTWVLTLRGPWADTWMEYVPGKVYRTLTWGRKVVE